MAPLCKFWQQGTCRNGENCRFDHPPKNQGNQGFANNNRYAPLQNSNLSNPRSNSGFHGGAGGGRPEQAQGPPFALDKAAIITDLTNERPQWILSAYGPGRAAPAQLFGGPMREQSFEEIRLLHYMGITSGNPQQAAQEADKLVQASEQQIQTAVGNIDGAITFILNLEREHPNRIDICSLSTKADGGYAPNLNPAGQGGGSTGAFATNSSGSNPFAAAPNQPTTTSGFGQPSAIGQTSNPFRAASTAAPTGGFGQPSAMGQKPNPFGAAPTAAPIGWFGQPSAMGQRPNPFGAAPAPTGGFGQSSGLGQKASPFAPSNPNHTAAPFSAFANKPSPFSQQPQTTPSNGFGASSQPTTSTGFPPAPTNPFNVPSGQNASPFSNPSSQPGIFAQPSGQNPSPFANSNPASQPPPFSGVSASPFGQPSPAPANPFQTPTTSAATPAANPFASSTPQPQLFTPEPSQQPPQSPPTTINPFRNSSQAPAASGFGFHSGGTSQPSSTQPTVNGEIQNGSIGWQKHPVLASYATLAPDGKRLGMFKGRHVVYHGEHPGIESGGQLWKRIWCPKGFPPASDTEMDESFYNENVEAAYKHLRQAGSFQGAVMPMIPPKREWCKFDF